VSAVVNNIVDNDAKVVKLRRGNGCIEGGVVLNNCFNSMQDLMTWLNNTRKPQGVTTAPLVVEIGAGTFTKYTCLSGQNDISFKGSGRGVTILTDGTTGITGGVEATNCSRINFQDLTIRGTFIPVYWHDGGSSTWTNVDVEGGAYAWSETCYGEFTSRATHYWFDSRLYGNSKAYLISCSENWFFGSQIISQGQTFTVFQETNTSIIPELHVYGSVIRAIAAPGYSYGPPSTGGEGSGLLAVNAGKNAMVHIHGTGIDVIGNELPNDFAALAAGEGATIHASQSSFSLHPGPAGGNAIRILKDNNSNTHVHASYLWEEHTTPPNIISVTGADMAVVTDGTQPHLLIYSSNCTSKWFDTSANACRP
jgi:hypothetical protein